MIARFVFCLLMLSVAAQAAGPQFNPPVVSGTVAVPAINEASGLAVSRANAGVLWTHNDSGDSARAFAINIQGQLLATCNLSGAGATDWEDMTLGPGPLAGQSYLYMGDIGDNNAVRSGGVRVYRVAEPAVSSGQAPVTADLSGVESFTLVYPDGPRDAETLMIDPVNGDLYVVSKRDALGRVYRAAAGQLVNGATITMEFKTTLPWSWATGGDISPDGDEVLVRGYANASLWQRPAGTNLWDAFAGTAWTVPLAIEGQGESVAFDAAGSGYYTLSEGTNQPLYSYSRVPEPATACLLALGALAVLRRRTSRPR